MKATLKDVAKLAGTSTTTVSHVINQSRYVSPDVVKRIEEAIRETGYSTHKTENLIKGMIVLLLPSYQIPAFTDLAEYISNEFAAKKYQLVTLQAGKQDGGSNTEWFLRKYRSSICAVIAVASGEAERIASGLAEEMPVVFIGEPKTEQTNCVCFDDENAFYNATRLFLKYGHERVAFCASRDELFCTGKKRKGYIRAHEEMKESVDPEIMYCSSPLRQAIYGFMDRMMAMQDPPTAIVCGSSFDVLCVSRYMAEHDLHCPEHLSVIGCNDSQSFGLSHWPITAIMQEPAKIGDAAVKMVCDILDTGAAQQSVCMPTRLEIRDSIKTVIRGRFGELAASPDLLDLTEADSHKVYTSSFTAALSLHDTNSQLMKTYEAGIRDVFEKLGIKLNMVMDAHFDPLTQSQQIQSLLSQNLDVVIALPADEKRTAQSFRELAGSKTKIVLLDNVPEGLEQKDFVSCITGNDRENGHLIGRLIGRHFADRKNAKVGLLMYGVEGTTSQRDNSVLQALTNEFPELEIAAVTPFYGLQNVYEACKTMMLTHPDITGLYVPWDTAANIAMRALRDIGCPDVVIATADLGFEVAQSMASDGMIIGIGAQRPYEQGAAAAKAAANALLGKTVPSFVSVHPCAVTRENLAKRWKEITKSRIPDSIYRALHSNYKFK